MLLQNTKWAICSGMWEPALLARTDSSISRNFASQSLNKATLKNQILKLKVK